MGKDGRRAAVLRPVRPMNDATPVWRSHRDRYIRRRAIATPYNYDRLLRVHLLDPREYNRTPSPNQAAPSTQKHVQFQPSHCIPMKLWGIE